VNGDGDERYAANLRRWAAMELSVFRVADWDGTWLLGNSAGLGSVPSDDTHRFWGTMSQDVWHRRPGVRGDAITVTSSRPQGDSDRYARFGNMAIQILKDRQAEDRSDLHQFELMDLLSQGAFPAHSATFSVDGEAIPFELFVVGNVWLACAELDDLTIEILGHDAPFTDLRLTRVTEPPPTRSA
jgi:hypothetical protein